MSGIALSSDNQQEATTTQPDTGFVDDVISHVRANAETTEDKDTMEVRLDPKSFPDTSAQNTMITEQLATMQQSQAQTNAQFAEALTTMSQAIAGLNPQKPEVNEFDQRLADLEISPELTEKYAGSLPLIENTAKRAALEGDREMNAQLSQLREEIAKRDARFDEMDRARIADKAVVHRTHLESLFPNYAEMTESAEFKEFLSTPVAEMGGLAPELLWDKADENSNTALSVKIATAFRDSEKGTKFRRAPVSQMAVPGQTGTPSNVSASDKPSVSESQLDQLEDAFLYGNKFNDGEEYMKSLELAQEKMIANR